MAASQCQGHCNGLAGAPICSKPDKGLEAFWHKLPLQQRRQLCSIPRRTLFEAIRNRYCSRCFGLFALRYEELRCSNGTPESDGCPACKACPACQDFFLGLQADAKSVFLEESMLQGSPFEMFAQSKARERERDLQFMTAGDVCGSGFNARRNGKVCALHTTRVSPETLLAYWGQLPAEHCTALFSLPRHDFEAELDSCCSMQLRICKDCRYNVLAQYKLALSAARKAAGHTRGSTDGDSSTAAAGGRVASTEAAPGTVDGGSPDASPAGSKALAVVPAHPLLPVCEGFSLRVTDVTVELVGTDAAMLLEEAEEIEDLKGDDGGEVRHAETPELAQEALIDAVILIFKAQVEVAFREQTAGHNALLLLVALSHELLEERLRNAFLDVHARAAEAELLELVAEDEKRLAARSSRSRRRKKGATSSASPAATASQRATAADRRAAAPCPAGTDGGVDPIDDDAPSTPRAAERAPPVAQDWPEDASPCEGPQSPPATPEADQHSQWEVQQRSRKSRRGSRQPDQGRPSASPSPNPAAAEACATARTQPLPPPPPTTAPPPPPTTAPQQQPHDSQQQSGWASVVSGAATTPTDAAAQRSSPVLQAAHQHDKPLAWPQLPSIRPQPASPVVPPPQPVRLRADSQQQPIAPSTRQPPPGFAVRMPPPAPQQPQQASRPGASVSRRSSTEYSLWGEDSSSRVPLSLSASHESLASASDMSFGSPPLAGSQGPFAAAGGHGGSASSRLPSAGSAPCKQPHSKPLSPAMPSLFQHFGPPVASAPQQPTLLGAFAATPSRSGDGFSLFSSFPAESSQHTSGGTSAGSTGSWPEAGFASMFGGSSILGRHKTMAQVMLA